MIVVGEIGSAIIKYTSDFSSFARSQGMRDPFFAEMELFEKRCHKDESGNTYIECGIITQEEKILQDEKDKYIKAREEYITDRLFQNFGYSAILNRTHNKKYIPCEGADGQCHMDCYMNGECQHD